MRRSIQAAFLVVASLSYIAVQAVPAFASTVTSASPSALAPGDTSVDMTLTGTGFDTSVLANTSVTFSGSGVTADAGSITVQDATHIKLKVTVVANATENTDFVNDRDITVSQVAGTNTGTCTKCLHIGPVISSFAPGGTTMTASGPQTATITNITGRAFRTGATLELRRTNIGFNAAESPTIASSASSVSGCDGTTGLCTTMDGTFPISGATPGGWTLVVKNTTPAGAPGIGKASNTYAINTAGPPTLTSITPGTVGQGAGGSAGTTVDVFGTNLMKGLTLTFKTVAPNPPGVDANVVQTAAVSQWIDATHVKVPVQVKTAALIGNRDVVVTNDPPGGANAPCAGCFTVTAGPTVTTVAPSTLGQGATAVDLTVTGTNFVATPTATLKEPGLATACVGTSVTSVTFTDATHLVVRVNVASNAVAGHQCDLVVTNSDLGTVTKANAITVATGPVLNTVTPNVAPQGRTNLDLTFDGTGFHTGANKPGVADITFSGNPADITVNSTTTNDPIGSTGVRLTVNVTISQSAAATSRDVTIRNPDDKGQFTKTAAFGVNLGPAITTITPSTLGQSATSKVLAIVGDHFNNTPSALTIAISGTGVTVNTGGVQFVDAQHVNVTVSVANNAPVGTRDLTLTNGDGGIVTKPNALTVTAAPTFAPTNPVQPNTIGVGAVSKTITIDGTNFSTTGAPTLTFTGTGITVNSLTVSSNGSQLTAVLSVDPGAATGARSVTVTNPDFGNATCAGCLTVTAPPTVQSINPGSGANNAALSNFAVTGTNFASGATVQLERNGFRPIPMTATSSTGSTQLVGTLPLDTPYAESPGLRSAPGAWRVRVTNPDGGSALLPNPGCTVGSCVFTVTSATPTVTVGGISPNEVPVGGFLTITLTGSNFADGTIVDFGPGVLVGNINVTSATQMTADVNLADASPGLNDVHVINADGAGSSGRGCANCLLISPAPTIDGMDPPIANPTGQQVKYTIFGSGFQSGASLFVSPGNGITVGTPLVTSPNTLEVLISVDSDQPAGFRTLRVANPDTGVGACFGCFEVHNQGFWMDATDGGIFTGGSAPFLGSMGGNRLNQPVVGMAPLPGVDQGYWLVASDGGIFTFGAAAFHGSTGSIRLNQPIVGMAATPSGDGYWLVASDGGIFSFGDAAFHGSTGSIRLNKPVVGMAATPTGGGYWLVASDGGIFAFGDAPFFGSAGSIRLNQPIVGMAAMPDGDGYRFVAADGGIFDYGSAAANPLGSLGGRTISAPIVGIAMTTSGNGYWLGGKDGRAYGFGDANDNIGPPVGGLNKPVVGIATAP